MDPRVFLLICLAAASRHQSSVLEVEANDPQDHAYNETDFQRLRDAVNSGDSDRMSRIARAEMWPSFLKAHPEEAWHLFEKLAKAEIGVVRQQAAYSPAWPMLFETRNAEAWHLFEQLATTDDMIVRMAAFDSPAWPMLLETHKAEAAWLFEKLATDENGSVRRAAMSSAWPDLVRSNWWESWRVFVKLMSNQSLGLLHHASLAELAESPAWKAFGNVPLTAVTEHLDSCTPTDLQEMAISLQKVADNGFTPNIKDLPLFKAPDCKGPPTRLGWARWPRCRFLRAMPLSDLLSW